MDWFVPGVNVTGSMDQPPLRSASSSSEVIVSNDDKAFVFGATLPRQRSEQIDVSVRERPM